MRRTAPTIEQAVDLAMEQTDKAGPYDDSQRVSVRRSWGIEVTLVRNTDGLIEKDVRVYHYGTLILTVAGANTLRPVAFIPAYGPWGSVTDQSGVNRVLRHLGIPLWATRADGDFQLLSTPQAGRNPAYIRN